MTKHKSSDERRTQILAAAKRCFIERGYEATRMQDISKESGLSKGGIYFHFESKMQVFMSLVEQEYEYSTTVMEGIAGSTTPANEQLGILAQHFLERFAHQTEESNFFIVMSEVALREEAIKEKLLTLQELYIERVSEFFQSGIDDGTFRPINARVAAIYLKSLIDGLEGNTALGLEIDLNTFIPMGMDLLLNGFLQPQS